MAPQSNPEAPPPASDDPAADSPSADDLLALIPDMELLETSALDAHAAHIAIAASASGRKTAAPLLSDPVRPSTVRTQAATAVINDDPYADLMPELEAYEEPVPPTRPVTQAVPAPQAPPAAARPMAAPAPSAAAAPPSAPRPKAAVAAPRPVAAARPAPAAAAARPVTPRPAPARKPPDPENVPVPPVMDPDFIARNRIVELYVSGKLPVRGATVFERYCRENPQLLDEIGLPERVHAGLRLLEASGKPEPWQEKPKRFWEGPYVPLALAVLVVVLGIGLLVLNKALSAQLHKVSVLQQLVIDQPLDAATATTTVDIQPTHAGPAAAIAAVIGGTTAQLVNIKIDLTHSDFRAFRVTIDRMNQGRVAILNNLVKDSNGALGFSLNTSALGAGGYQLTIEGLDWRGDPQPDSWAAISIRH
jgi:hypothetical protein